jgi:hypothetical protein
MVPPSSPALLPVLLTWVAVTPTDLLTVHVRRQRLVRMRLHRFPSRWSRP